MIFATGKRSICVLTLLLKNGKSPSFLLNESDFPFLFLGKLPNPLK